MKDSEKIKKATGIIDELLKLFDIEVEKAISMEVDTEDEEFLKVDLRGDNLGMLIGYKGNTLNALQLIFAQILSTQLDEVVTVLIDINDYRQKREKYLKSLGLKAARQAMENKQDVELPPLSAYERRIIHMALKGEEGVSTESIGEGFDRHIVVKIEK